MTPTSRELYDELFDYARHQPKVNTHCHQLPVPQLRGFDLDSLLRNSYVNWIGIPWDSSSPSRAALFEKIRFNSFFVCLQKGLAELYGSDEPLSGSSWQSWDERIRAAYQDPSHPEGVFAGPCAYRRMILDAYWDPGSNNTCPGLYAPAFRVNSFFFGYSTIAADSDGANPYALYSRDFIFDLDDYVGWLRACLLSRKASGCVALKLPIAYDRGLDFREISRDRARAAFTRLAKASPGELPQVEKTAFPENAPVNSPPPFVAGADPEDVKTFQDYLFFQLCRIAAEADLPLQIHTGMGQGHCTNAFQLLEAIQKFPETRFVLLHCSYPWVEDISLLVTGYPNVYPDLSWVPLLSTQAAARLLQELIERSTIDRICWGCDTWTAEESYGSLLAFCHVLASTLTKMSSDGYFSTRDAYGLIDQILFDNPRQLYESATVA